jgi:hypothetical protein
MEEMKRIRVEQQRGLKSSLMVRKRYLEQRPSLKMRLIQHLRLGVTRLSCLELILGHLCKKQQHMMIGLKEQQLRKQIMIQLDQLRLLLVMTILMGRKLLMGEILELLSPMKEG